MQTDTSPRQLADDLRASVRDYRNPATSDTERAAIRSWWASLAVPVPNQFAAMLRAAELDADTR